MLCFRIEDIIPKTEKKPPHVYSAEMAEEQYINCVQKLAEVLTESYRVRMKLNHLSFMNREKYKKKLIFKEYHTPIRMLKLANSNFLKLGFPRRK